MPEISAVICNRIGDRRQDGLGCIAMHACIYTTLNNVLCVSVCVCVCACEWAEGDPGRCSQVRRMAGLWYSMASVASHRMPTAAAGGTRIRATSAPGLATGERSGGERLRSLLGGFRPQPRHLLNE